MANNLFSVTGRVALVSGAGSGIGSYIAKGLADAGVSRVYITGRRDAPLQSVASYSPKVIIPFVGDVATKEGCVAIAKQFVEHETAADVSDVSLDILVNNAGWLGPEGTFDSTATPEQVSEALLKAPDETWMAEFAVNVGSIQWLSAALLPYLARAAKHKDGFREGRGSIVNNTSVSGLFVSAHIPTHIYCATKAAAESLTQNLASKFTRHGVRVNSIAIANIPSQMNNPDDPGSFISRIGHLVPIGRIGNEEDAVGATIYLSSRAGSYVSGSVIKLDGGSLVAG